MASGRSPSPGLPPPRSGWFDFFAWFLIDKKQQKNPAQLSGFVCLFWKS